MSLQSVERLAAGPVAERIEQVVDGLDDVIRDIRETIFRLERPAVAESGLRREIDRVVAAAAQQLGFEPRVGFHGPVDAATSAHLKPHVMAVLTEALSNVARHARASAVEVVIVDRSRGLTRVGLRQRCRTTARAERRQRVAQHCRTGPLALGLFLDNRPSSHWDPPQWRVPTP